MGVLSWFSAEILQEQQLNINLPPSPQQHICNVHIGTRSIGCPNPYLTITPLSWHSMAYNMQICC